LAKKPINYYLKIYSIMKSFFLLCSLLLIANLSFGQDVTFKNNTAFILTVGVQYTCESPNICPPSIAGSMSAVLAPGADTTLTLPAPYSGCTGPNRPYIMGAAILSGGSESWQVNHCWNPSCVTNAGPFTITNTCSDTNTVVTID
jgi:hypothetical protein